METRIIDSEKGYLWPVDKLCTSCNRNIHISSKDNLRKIINKKTKKIQYFSVCKCGNMDPIQPDMIPAEIRTSL